MPPPPPSRTDKLRFHAAVRAGNHSLIPSFKETVVAKADINMAYKISAEVGLLKTMSTLVDVFGQPDSRTKNAAMKLAGIGGHTKVVHFLNNLAPKKPAKRRVSSEPEETLATDISAFMTSDVRKSSLNPSIQPFLITALLNQYSESPHFGLYVADIFVNMSKRGSPESLKELANGISAAVEKKVKDTALNPGQTGGEPLAKPISNRPCPNGKERIPSGRCVSPCKGGKTRNPSTSRCGKQQQRVISFRPPSPPPLVVRASSPSKTRKPPASKPVAAPPAKFVYDPKTYVVPPRDRTDHMTKEMYDEIMSLHLHNNLRNPPPLSPRTIAKNKAEKRKLDALLRTARRDVGMTVDDASSSGGD